MVGALSGYLPLPIKMISVYQEERRRQLEVKLTIEEQLRLRREEEEEQERKRREEEQREMERRRKEAAKGIKRFNERVRIVEITEKHKTSMAFVMWGCDVFQGCDLASPDQFHHPYVINSRDIPDTDPDAWKSV